LCCFQITQFLSIMAQVPLTPSQRGCQVTPTHLSDGHRSAISKPKMKLIQCLLKCGTSRETTRLASYTNTLIGWAPKCNQQTKNETYSRLLKCSTSRGNNADQLRWLAAVAESLG
jgi:hypothetical protein